MGVHSPTQHPRGSRPDSDAVVNVLCDLSEGLAVWTSFIFQSILNNAFRLAARVRVHQIKKIALNYPINIIIFAPLQHYIMKQSGFTHLSPSALIYKGAMLVNENWIVIMQLVQMKNCSENEDTELQDVKILSCRD